MELINRFCNSFLFWAAWIIIPVMMEIVPSLGSVFVLIKKHIFHKEIIKPAIDPEISLIIPIYNSMDTLEQCIRSIDESDYPDERIRIFLVNNQGQDDSFQVFCDCQQKYPQLQMQWLNAKQGKSKALNMALFNSEGKYIIHIDSDGLLERSALRNMVYRFEADQTIECMTGVILTDPKQVQAYPPVLPRILRKVEFMEYAQAFLAGRNYSAEVNAVYTLSGAFSAFRKSAVLKSQLYNTDTICEDTQITFQMKYLQKTKVGICEDAIFFVDPIEDMNKLYTQRQRWQRGSLEVSHLFLKDKLKARNMLTNVGVRTLLYDHTFAFPRMIWYLALICLLCMNYSFAQIGYSTLFLYGLYVLIGVFYYISTVGFLKNFKEIRKYYAKQWYVIPVLPIFNLMVFFIRFAGVINSINTDSAWKTRNFTQEKESFVQTVAKDFSVVGHFLGRIRDFVNNEE
ncbi:TIGR03111 family XrtG-associated glycosyltransferase [Roseburia sp. AM59-24XD]|jgi:biofilm PGA synthesis N-glycosyltransferase PgaC|uniref:TIGR03111 family XrtG-associated glycosyltransferase n=1 Tax=Roseburia sp. AM59-24XD TaxID=2293138 RepID=UPI000E54CE43|nr:TIGR03111 family XrtG-associated glycosyltransferase [Roseburia sp. AM59-24XD]RHP88131.1 putative glycosyltransferase, exosortase G system-associated [Roseburia sp. AM59-24XD]